MTLKINRFIAFLFVALVLGAGLAHLFTMPGKMVLGRDAYLTVQQLYRDWVLGSLAQGFAILSLAVLAWQLRRRRPRALVLTLLALLTIIGDELVVWTLARGVDRATGNWTMLPENWMALRAQWEYAHVGAATLDLLAFTALVLSVLVAERPTRYRGPDESAGGRGAPLRFMAVR